MFLPFYEGFRYELWCIARAAGTNCCCVVTVSNYDECRKRNNSRTEKTYSEKQFDELIMRWEEPDKNRRWEKPLLPYLDEDEVDIQVFIDAISGIGITPYLFLKIVHNVDRALFVYKNSS